MSAWWEKYPEIVEFAKSYLREGRTGLMVCDTCLEGYKERSKRGEIRIDQIIMIDLPYRERKIREYEEMKSEILKKMYEIDEESEEADKLLEILEEHGYICPLHSLPKRNAIFFEVLK